MMLFYKAWLETRTRFLLSVAALAGLSAIFVLMNQGVRESITSEAVTYPDYIWKAIFKGHLRDIFVLLALLLGMGGLERERSYGTAGFTLTLPIARWRLTAVRGLAGMMETALLAFLPAVIVPLLSPLAGQTYPWFTALRFGMLWTIGGVLIFAMGFLASIFFAGEYSAPIAAIGFLFAYSVLADVPGVERYVVDIHDIMNGTGPHGFSTLASLSLVAFSMIAVGGYVTMRRDY
jgi:ABC-type transport system involved in multi-copper enzyme maturation permease subunit